MRRMSRIAGCLICAMLGFNSPALLAVDIPVQDGTDLIGVPAETRSVYEDTLLDIARNYRLGYEEIRLANPDVDTWIPGEGTRVQLPTQYLLPRSSRNGLVINVAEYRMYYFFVEDDQVQVRTFPISIGRMDWETPLGRTRVVAKAKDPAWYPPESIRREWAEDGRELGTYVPPGPDNPLGRYAMRLGIPGYLIHGTNRPAGVGMRVTHGCLRMYPEDIEWVFAQVPLETPVEIVNQPFKMGWSGDDLYLEVHPPLAEAGATLESAQGDIVVGGAAAEPVDMDDSRWSMTRITELYVETTRERPADVDWAEVKQVFDDRLGVPVRIGVATDAAPESMALSTSQ